MYSYLQSNLIQEMTKLQAAEHLIAGQCIKHSTFEPDTFVYKGTDDVMYDQNNDPLPHFWKDVNTPEFNEGWTVTNLVVKSLDFADIEVGDFVTIDCNHAFVTMSDTWEKVVMVTDTRIKTRRQSFNRENGEATNGPRAYFISAHKKRKK